MKKIVRFSEGNADDWQAICEGAVKAGYTVEVSIPDVVVVDDEKMNVYSTRYESPNTVIEELQYDFVTTPADLEMETIEYEALPELESIPEPSNETIVREDDLVVATTSPQVRVERTNGIVIVAIG